MKNFFHEHPILLRLILVALCMAGVWACLSIADAREYSPQVLRASLQTGLKPTALDWADHVPQGGSHLQMDMSKAAFPPIFPPDNFVDPNSISMTNSDGSLIQVVVYGQWNFKVHPMEVVPDGPFLKIPGGPNPPQRTWSRPQFYQLLSFINEDSAEWRLQAHDKMIKSALASYYGAVGGETFDFYRFEDMAGKHLQAANIDYLNAVKYAQIRIKLLMKAQGKAKKQKVL